MSDSGWSEVTRRATSVKSVWLPTLTQSSPPSCCLTLTLLLTILASTTTAASDQSDQSSQPAQTQSWAGQVKVLQGRDFSWSSSQGWPPHWAGEAGDLVALLTPPPQEVEQGCQVQADHWQSRGQQPGAH